MQDPPIPFRPFDEHGDVRIYFNCRLLHWRQPGCTYFVTFRLADSIPRAVIAELEEDRTRWLRAHGINPDDRLWCKRLLRLPTEQQRTYASLTDERTQRSLDDCLGACLLRDNATRELVTRALTHFHGERVWTGDFVVMPNHDHALMTPILGFELEDILHSIKSFTALQINRLLGRSGALWQRESYDHIVRTSDELAHYQDYVAINPEKAKLNVKEFTIARGRYQLFE